MTVTVSIPGGATSAFDLISVPERRAASAGRLRGLLVIGCIAAVAVAGSIGDPTSTLQTDRELAFLLRGMAVLKALMVLAAAAVLLWRFAHPLSTRLAAAYIAGTAVLAGASMLIWQLSFIALSALGFHMAAFVLLVAAWHDRGGRSALLRGVLHRETTHVR